MATPPPSGSCLVGPSGERVRRLGIVGNRRSSKGDTAGAGPVKSSIQQAESAKGPVCEKSSTAQCRGGNI